MSIPIGKYRKVKE